MSPLSRAPFLCDIHDLMILAEQVKAGSIRAVSRLISLLENHPGGREVLRLLNSASWGTRVIGVTGYPGAGKSTVVNRLVSFYRRQGLKVGVLAVDHGDGDSRVGLDVARLAARRLREEDNVPVLDAHPERHAVRRAVGHQSGEVAVVPALEEALDVGFQSGHRPILSQ